MKNKKLRIILIIAIAALVLATAIVLPIVMCGGKEKDKADISFKIDAKSTVIYKDYDTTFTAVLMENGVNVPMGNSDVSWSIKNTDIATVDNGKITGVSVGETTLTAEYIYKEKEYSDSVTIKVEELSIYLAETKEKVIATTKTYGGDENEASTTSAIVLKKLMGKTEEVVTDFSGITFTSSDENIAKVVNGKVVAGDKAGVATINLTDGVSTGYFDVNVYTAISSKFDLDMLALSYARETNAEDWGVSAKYLLTGNIDYNGDIFIPIAANTGRGLSYNLIGKQWKTVLSENNNYGLSYDNFKKTGLNAAYTSDGMAETVFRGTIDGNGYSILNAELMLDAAVGLYTNNSKEYPTFTTSAIGLLGTGSVVKNIGFKNFTYQKMSDAGYDNFEEPTSLSKVGENAGEQVVNFKENYYYGNCMGIIGGGEGTLENVYLELCGTMDGPLVSTGHNNHKFGRWSGNSVFNNCVFVDKFTDNDQSTNGDSYSIRTDSTASINVNSFLLISDLPRKLDKGEIIGEYIYETTVEKYDEGVQEGKYSISLDEKYWNLTEGVPKFK